MNDPWRRVFNPVQKDWAIYLETCEESGGERSLFEIELAPGGGNPAHYHLSYSERFEVLEGALGVNIGGRTQHLSVGQSALVPPGTPHRFFSVAPEPARFRCELRPGHTGFENAIRILYGLARDGQTNAKGIPKNLQHLALIGALSDMRLAGFGRLMNPFLMLLSRRARARGLEARLLETYCTPPREAVAG